MRCEEARPLVSAAADAPLSEREVGGLRAHLSTCPRCTAFRAHIDQLRRELRYEVVDDAPDVAPAVLAAVRHARAPRRRSWASAVAVVFVVAFGIGALLAGPARTPPHVASASIPERVLAAQSTVSSLSARVRVVERGWHPQVGERRFAGRISYRAPESMVLQLRDRTTYPSASWHPGDVTLAAAEDRWWSAGPPPCPREAQPSCQTDPVVTVIEGREPFGDGAPVPLELVVPVRSFLLAQQPELLGTRTVADREAVGVAVTAAQVTPLLDGLQAAGDWRRIHPTDRAELWLDADALVPLELRILPAATAERELWAARHGYRDDPSVPIYEVALADVELASADQLRVPDPPSAPTVRERDAGFADADVETADPGWVPAGMAVHRRGTVRTGKGPAVAVATWTDGRAWLKVRATGEWPGGRLFGDLGDPVRRVDLGPAGVAYVDETGGKVALHGDGLDVVVSGSVAPTDLMRVAASLRLVGQPVPDGWAESPSMGIDEAVRRDPGLLLPAALDGFGEPTVRVDGQTTTVAWAGPGARGFVLTQGPGQRLAPPLHRDVSGVQVRGLAGRYTPGTGELEWVEDGRILSLRSRTLGIAELVRIAESLRAP